MVDFSHLAGLAVTRETTREYTFDRIQGDPSLIVSPATDDNEDFLNGRLELALNEAPAEEDARPRKQTGRLTPDDMKRQTNENREIDLKLIAQACVRGWGTPPIDKAGKPVPFSTENAHQFLCALPAYMVDPFRGFCGNIYNFAPRPGKAKPDGEKLGNS
jgi:hypothetical protein